MKFGIFCLGQKPPETSDAEVIERNIEQAALADELGYDEVWLAEHHFSPYGVFSNPMVLAAAIAQRTDRIRIGTAVAIPAFSQPILIAEQASMVDAISHGRFDLGLGRAYQQQEFQRFGVSMDESNERFVEAVEVIDGLLHNDSYSWEGKFSKGDGICLSPRPTQPSLPMYVAVTRTLATVQWAVQRGYNVLVGNPYVPDPDLDRSLRLFRDERGRQNVIGEGSVVWGLTRAFVHPDGDFARSFPKESVETYYDYLAKYGAIFSRGEPVPKDYSAYSDWFEVIDRREMSKYDSALRLRHTLIGSTDEVADRIREMRDGDGWENLILTFNSGGGMPQDEVLKSMTHFAREVMPQFKQ